MNFQNIKLSSFISCAVRIQWLPMCVCCKAAQVTQFVLSSGMFKVFLIIYELRLSQF